MLYLSKEQIIEKAKETIVILESQREALESIAELISNHLRRLVAIEHGIDPGYLPQNSILLIGSSGSGKSYLVHELAKIAGLSFNMQSCAQLTAEGYKGVNLSQAIYNAKKNSENKEAFSQGIMFFDEFDKIKGFQKDGCSQQDFLTVIEGKSITVNVGNDQTETIPTDSMLFIFAGAFCGLTEQIDKKINPKSIGFSPNHKEILNPIDNISIESVSEYGFSIELLGRIGLIKYVPNLTEQDLFTLTKGEQGHSYQKKYAQLFDVSGVSFEISNSAAETISQKALSSTCGARIISAIIQEKVSHAFSCIDNDETISKAILATQNKKLVVKFKRDGERTHEAWTMPSVKSESSFIDLNLSNNIASEKGINRLSKDLTKLLSIKSVEYSAFVFYFFQTTLRYLSLQLNSDEQTLESIIKLVDTTDRGIYQSSTFDNLIVTALESKINQHRLSALDYFYNMFSELYSKRSVAFLKYGIREICLEYSIANQNTLKKH